MWVSYPRKYVYMFSKVGYKSTNTAPWLSLTFICRILLPRVDDIPKLGVQIRSGKKAKGMGRI